MAETLSLGIVRSIGRDYYLPIYGSAGYALHKGVPLRGYVCWGWERMKSSPYSASPQALGPNAGMPLSAEKGKHFSNWPTQRSAFF